MRGKDGFLHTLDKTFRITPAHAGKSFLFYSFFFVWWDHPRTCGEKGKFRRESRPLRGSPPHMRGKVKAFSLLLCVVGITPAHAGKSSSRLVKNINQWDHPRTCGEKVIVLAVPSVFYGSPPHMRGKAQLNVSERHFYRITPAHAGKRRF